MTALDARRALSQNSRDLMAWLETRITRMGLAESRVLVDFLLAIEADARDADRLAEALRDVRGLLVGEHGHDGDACAPWPSCLPVHIALNRAKDALAALQSEGER